MNPRYKILQLAILVIVAIIVLRLFYIQIYDSSYKAYANDNALRYEVQFPPRGEVYDRKGEFLVQSKESYDLLVIPRDVKPFDTLTFCDIIGVPIDQVRKSLREAYAYSRRRPSVLFKQLPKEVKLKLDEKRFSGFFTQYRTVRTYPRKIAGNLLGYIGEVNDRIMAANPYYKMGDYIGMSGMEQAYEKDLRGKKGVKIQMVDVFGMPQGSYEGGRYDTMPEPGDAIVATLDASLQELGEELMHGKIGSIVAIEPATGEILVMVSSPSYDPDELVGRQRGNNYMKMLNDPVKPLFNRAVMALYPPGSTFKLVNALIGLQEQVLTPSNTYPCSMGYPYGRGMKCHAHPSPMDLQGAIGTSCNAYFCYVFRNIVDNPKYKSVKNGYAVWEEYVNSFGFGRKLDSDFLGELDGFVPSVEFYNKRYRGSWNSMTVLSLPIGQGELGITPLQMANFGATVANRGYYYIPHVVKSIKGQDSIDQRFREKHYTKVEPKYFEPIVNGMEMSTIGGTSRIANVVGLDICSKTGTAQNPRGADHSTFLCFAPKNNPKIVVSVYVEHGRWGASAAAPIASLIVEKYLTDTITRPDLVQRMKDMTISYPMYGIQ